MGSSTIVRRGRLLDSGTILGSGKLMGSGRILGSSADIISTSPVAVFAFANRVLCVAPAALVCILTFRRVSESRVDFFDGGRLWGGPISVLHAGDRLRVLLLFLPNQVQLRELIVFISVD